MTMISDIKRALRGVASESDAVFLQRFFRTGPGEYGEGDRFLGVRVPATRKLVRKFAHAPMDVVTDLLHSEWHEERLLALLLLVHKYAKGDAAERNRIYELYLANTKYINNWDLVDTSAEHIVGRCLLERGNSGRVLRKLARSENLWERRIAMLSTFHFIRQHEFDIALEIAELLMRDSHDLIHKASGWMLREVGNRDSRALTAFLDTHVHEMPRTMLRYAIEKLPEQQRLSYLKAKR